MRPWSGHRPHARAAVGGCGSPGRQAFPKRPRGCLGLPTAVSEAFADRQRVSAGLALGGGTTGGSGPDRTGAKESHFERGNGPRFASAAGATAESVRRACDQPAQGAVSDPPHLWAPWRGGSNAAFRRTRFPTLGESEHRQSPYGRNLRYSHPRGIAPLSPPRKEGGPRRREKTEAWGLRRIKVSYDLVPACGRAVRASQRTAAEGLFPSLFRN